jgi:antitoxin CcdA
MLYGAHSNAHNWKQALQAKLARANAEKWASDNRKAIRAYNDFVEEHGCFDEEYKEF